MSLPSPASSEVSPSTGDQVRPNRKLGMTASRNGMTPQQKVVFRVLLLRGNELHDGDCIGGDSDGFHIAKDEGLRTVSHPCNIARYRANNPHDETREVLPPLDRNRNIVGETAELFACPKGFKEEWRGSGTWAAIRLARAPIFRRPLVIIWPSGNTQIERYTPEEEALMCIDIVNALQEYGRTLKV